MTALFSGLKRFVYLVRRNADRWAELITPPTPSPHPPRQVHELSFWGSKEVYESPYNPLTHWSVSYLDTPTNRSYSFALISDELQWCNKGGQR